MPGRRSSKAWRGEGIEVESLRNEWPAKAAKRREILLILKSVELQDFRVISLAVTILRTKPWR